MRLPPLLARRPGLGRRGPTAASLVTLGLALAAGCAPAGRPRPHPAPRSAPGDSTLAGALAREATRPDSRDSTEARGPARGAVRGLANPVGVFPFAVTAAGSDPTLTSLGYALADLLITDLARSRRLTLVERVRLADVLRELGLSATDRVDPATAPRVGRVVRARQLVVGSLAAVDAARPLDPRGMLRFGVRLADVRTGSVAEAVDATAPLADVLAAEKAIAFRVFDALGVTLTPDERAAVEQRATNNLVALIAYGRGVREEYDGQYWRAAASYRRALRLDPGFRAAAIREAEVRALAEAGTIDPIITPGLRRVETAVASVVDRLNRPLDPISTLARSSTAADPSFPVTAATVLVTVSRP